MLRALFVVQGEGRGHLTQAVALKQILERGGHDVCHVVVGTGPHRALPKLFVDEFPQLTRVPSFRFIYRGRRQVDWGRTYAWNVRRLGLFHRSLRCLDDVVTAARPDVVVGFFEPLLGLHRWLFPARIPAVAVAHQYLLWHPRYPAPRQYLCQRLGHKALTSVTAYHSHRIALSFYPTREYRLPATDVCPPLLRQEVLGLKSVPGDYLLVYLLNSGYVPEIVDWQERHRDIPVHCFCDAPQPAGCCSGVQFHGLDAQLFLAMMAGCRGVACTAGFETTSEAAWLGKPLLMVPVRHYYEQYLNAIDAERCGLCVRSDRFDLDLLLGTRPGNRHVADWFGQAPDRYLEVVERVARRDCPPGRLTLHRAKPAFARQSGG